jgi:hypothetical protein
MQVINVEDIKAQLLDYIKNKDNSGIILKEKIENDLISNGVHGEEKEKILKYIFEIISLIKK